MNFDKTIAAALMTIGIILYWLLWANSVADYWAAISKGIEIGY